MNDGNMSEVERLTQRVRELNSHYGRRVSYTLELGRGETYHSGKPTLYAHHPYPRSSVLAGREARVFLHQWEKADEARADCRAAGVKRLRDMLDGGTTHTPISQIVGHLPDDTDY